VHLLILIDTLLMGLVCRFYTGLYTLNISLQKMFLKIVYFVLLKLLRQRGSLSKLFQTFKHFLVIKDELLTAE